MSDPWLKFYPTDWRADPALRMCSAAARGVWIDLICLMHEATPYGHLLVNGRCPTDAQVAVLTGTPPDQLTQCLRELEDAGVFSRTKDGTIYSRKMTRMAKKAATARNNGRKGGNPSLRKDDDIAPSDNPTVKGGVKPQKPEARSQIERGKPLSKRARRATRINPDAEVTEAQLRAGFKRGHSEREIRAQFDKFKTSALANGRSYVDWDAAFVTWLDSEYFRLVFPKSGNVIDMGAFGAGEVVR